MPFTPESSLDWTASSGSGIAETPQHTRTPARSARNPTRHAHGSNGSLSHSVNALKLPLRRVHPRERTWGEERGRAVGLSVCPSFRRSHLGEAPNPGIVAIGLWLRIHAGRLRVKRRVVTSRPVVTACPEVGITLHAGGGQEELKQEVKRGARRRQKSTTNIGANRRNSPELSAMIMSTDGDSNFREPRSIDRSRESPRKR